MILNARMIFKKKYKTKQRRKAILLFVKKKQPKKPKKPTVLLSFKFLQNVKLCSGQQPRDCCKFFKKNGLICLRTLFICLFIYLEFIYFAINIQITDIILLFHTSFLSVCNVGMYWRTTDTHRYNNFPDFSACDIIPGR